jgi:hypothetical protein
MYSECEQMLGEASATNNVCAGGYAYIGIEIKGGWTRRGWIYSLKFGIFDCDTLMFNVHVYLIH